MKRLILGLFLISSTLFSCSSDDTTNKYQQKTVTVAKGDDGNPNIPQAPTEAQIKEATSVLTTEVEYLTEHPNEVNSRNIIRFCGNPSFSGTSGGGYAEVKLGDGSTYYFTYSWFINSSNKTIVAAHFEGTSAPAGSGC